MSAVAPTGASTAGHGWAVKFAGACIPFATRADAKRFVKANQKDIVDQRGGTFKAQIVRIAPHDLCKEDPH